MAAGRIDPLALREHTEQLPVPATVALCFSFIPFPFFLSLSLFYSSSFSPSSFVCLFCFYHHMMRSGALFLLSAKHRECNRLPAAIAYTTDTRPHTYSIKKNDETNLYVRMLMYIRQKIFNVTYVWCSHLVRWWYGVQQGRSNQPKRATARSKIEKKQKKNKKRSKT